MSASRAAPESALSRMLTKALLFAVSLSGGALIALSPDIAVPAAVLLLPGLVMLLLDRSHGSGVALAILLFQGASTLRLFGQAWYRCTGLHDCIDYLCAPEAVARVWLAALLAFLLSQVLPIGLKLWDDHRIRARRELLAERRKALAEEWGLEEMRKG